MSVRSQGLWLVGSTQTTGEKSQSGPGLTCAVTEEESESEWDWKAEDTGLSARGDHLGSTPRQGQVQP